MRRTAMLLAGLTAIALPLAACGDDDDDDTGNPDDGGPPATDVVTVVAESVSGFDEVEYAAPPGEVTIRFENADSIPHNVVIEEEPDFKLEEDGEEDTIELEPGNYTLYCDVPGHRDAGMEASMNVG